MADATVFAQLEAAQSALDDAGTGTTAMLTPDGVIKEVKLEIGEQLGDHIPCPVCGTDRNHESDQHGYRDCNYCGYKWHPDKKIAVVLGVVEREIRKSNMDLAKLVSQMDRLRVSLMSLMNFRDGIKKAIMEQETKPSAKKE